MRVRSSSALSDVLNLLLDYAFATNRPSANLLRELGQRAVLRDRLTSRHAVEDGCLSQQENSQDSGGCTFRILFLTFGRSFVDAIKDLMDQNEDRQCDHEHQPS